MKLALRIDVDTLRGTRQGVPALCHMMARHGVRGTFFFSVGPDNMGRHVWRLIRPAFFLKMLRSRAVGLYGWDILLRGTFWPGPHIGRACADIIRMTDREGHEAGFHAWDHHAWQTDADRMPLDQVRTHLELGVEALSDILGACPVCSAAPAWRSTDWALLEKERWPFRFNSDCRGVSVFRPRVEGRVLIQPQIPTTLPTYDEVIGRDGVTADTYNDYIFSRLSPNGLNVLTIHAEVEGIVCASWFERFLQKAKATGIAIVPLGDLIKGADDIPSGILRPGELPGREGWVSVQHVAPGATKTARLRSPHSDRNSSRAEGMNAVTGCPETCA